MDGNTPGNGINGDYPRFRKQAFVRNDFPPKSDIAKVLELIIENGLPGKLEINFGGAKAGDSITSITFWERHPVEVETSE